MDNEQTKKQCEKLEAAKNTVKDPNAKKALEQKIAQIGKEVKK